MVYAPVILMSLAQIAPPSDAATSSVMVPMNAGHSKARTLVNAVAMDNVIKAFAFVTRPRSPLTRSALSMLLAQVILASVELEHAMLKTFVSALQAKQVPFAPSMFAPNPKPFDR